MPLIVRCLPVTLLLILGVAADYQFAMRLQRFRSEALHTDHCDFWLGLYKLVDGRVRHVCERHILQRTLVVNEDTVIGMAWLAKNYKQLSYQVSNDLLASLTTLPFWLDQGGRFKLPYKLGVLNHWQESSQIAWLVGGYFIGEAFDQDQNKSDIIFNGIDQTGLILTIECRQRIWRWLDERQQYGFDRLDVKALTAVMTLATLVHEEKLQRLASMLFFLQMYEIQNSYWNGHFLSPKVSESDERDFQGLHWLLTGVGEMSLTSRTALIFSICQSMGLALPVALHGQGFVEHGPVIYEESFGTTMGEASSPPAKTSDDCMFWLGQGEGLYSHLACYVKVGQEYKLWHRHPKWQSKMIGLRKLQKLNSEEIYILEAILDVFDLSAVEKTCSVTATDNFALVSVQSKVSKGELRQDCSSPTWKLWMSDGGSVTVDQPLRVPHKCLQVQPQIHQFRSTVFTLNNPLMVLSAVLNTGRTVAHLNLHFDRVFTENTHWFIGQTGDVFMALYSHKSIRWDVIQQVDWKVGINSFNVSTLGSANFWICHVEEVTEAISFESFVQKVLSSQMQIQEHFEDDFHECLNKNHCFSGGAFRLLRCLRDKCKLRKYWQQSQLAECLSDNYTMKAENISQSNDSTDAPTITLDRQLVQMSKCLYKPLLDLEFKWQIGLKVFHVGWGKPLRVWNDNIEVQLPHNRFRYRSEHHEIGKLAKEFQLYAPNGAGIDFDFKRISYKNVIKRQATSHD